MQCIHLAVQICRLSYKSTQTFVTFGVPNLDVHLWLQIGLYHTTCCCHRQCDGDRQHKALRSHNGDQSHDHKFLENLHPNVSASAFAVFDGSDPWWKHVMFRKSDQAKLQELYLWSTLFAPIKTRSLARASKIALSVNMLAMFRHFLQASTYTSSSHLINILLPWKQVQHIENICFNSKIQLLGALLGIYPPTETKEATEVTCNILCIGISGIKLLHGGSSTHNLHLNLCVPPHSSEFGVQMCRFYCMICHGQVYSLSKLWSP